MTKSAFGPKLPFDVLTITAPYFPESSHSKKRMEYGPTNDSSADKAAVRHGMEGIVCYAA
jgi:hypothetical protein